jgi:hypothetical protein
MQAIRTGSQLKRVLPKTKLLLFAESLGTSWATAVGVDLVLAKGSLLDMAHSIKTFTAKSL